MTAAFSESTMLPANGFPEPSQSLFPRFTNHLTQFKRNNNYSSFDISQRSLRYKITQDEFELFVYKMDVAL